MLQKHYDLRHSPHGSAVHWLIFSEGDSVRSQADAVSRAAGLTL